MCFTNGVVYPPQSDESDLLGGPEPVEQPPGWYEHQHYDVGHRRQESILILSNIVKMIHEA